MTVTPPTIIPVSAVIVPVAVKLRNPVMSFDELTASTLSPDAIPAFTLLKTFISSLLQLHHQVYLIQQQLMLYQNLQFEV